jgi:drug/metabolite transporter (DMT)-like permease
MNRPWARIALLALGIFCASTAVILIKSNDDSPFLIAAYRLLIATIILTPFFLNERRVYAGPYGWKQVRLALLPGLALALHFITWNVGVQMTPVSNASLIINMTPVAMPFFLWIFFRERINRKEVIGTVLVLSGLIWLGVSSQKISLVSFRGNLICFVSMLFLAMYMALGRRNSSRLPLWLYMVPLYLIAGLICLGSATLFVNPIKAYSLKNLLIFLGLAVIPTIGGHGILNYSMKFFRGQVVSIAYLGQIIFSTIMAFIIFGEVPIPAFYMTAVLIISGVIVTLSSGYQRRTIKQPA